MTRWRDDAINRREQGAQRPFKQLKMLGVQALLPASQSGLLVAPLRGSQASLQPLRQTNFCWLLQAVAGTSSLT